MLTNKEKADEGMDCEYDSSASADEEAIDEDTDYEYDSSDFEYEAETEAKGSTQLPRAQSAHSVKKNFTCPAVPSKIKGHSDLFLVRLQSV